MGQTYWKQTEDVGFDPQAVAVDEKHPLPVRPILTDEDPPLPVRVMIGSKVDPVVGTPATYNVTLTSADTEYTQALPVGCRRFEFQCRTEAAMRFAFEANKVAGSTSPYMTLKAGDYYESGAIHMDNPYTLYLASATAGVVIELLVWV